MWLISKIPSLLQKTRFGFRINEIMTGEHRFEPGFGPPGYHPMEFCCTWGPENIFEWLNPKGDKFLFQSMNGTVTIGGLCHDTPMEGTLELKYFDEKRIRYTFYFTVADTDYRFVGEKVNILPWNLPTSHTTCFGRLTEEQTGKLVSTSITYFKLKNLWDFISSLRLA